MMFAAIPGISVLITTLWPPFFAAVEVITPSGKSYNFSWGIVIFLIALGLLVALSPVKRTYEVKKPKE